MFLNYYCSLKLESLLFYALKNRYKDKTDTLKVISFVRVDSFTLQSLVDFLR